MSKEKLFHDDKAQTWKIMVTNAKGEESTRMTVADVEAMSDSESIKVFQGFVSKEADARRAAISLQCSILVHGKADKDLKEWIGNGDKKTGQLQNGLKDAFRDMETAYFKQFMAEDHPAHKSFVNGLPKANEMGEAIEAEGKEQKGERFAYFLTRLRKNPSYGNAKNLTLRFLAFVGKLPYTDHKGGRTILPPEILRVMIQQALDLTPPDNSYETRLTQIIRELLVPEDPKKPVMLASDKLPGLVQDCKALLAEVQRQADVAAHYATQAHQTAGASVKDAAQTAIESAQATLDSIGKAKPQTETEKPTAKQPRRAKPTATH